MLCSRLNTLVAGWLQVAAWLELVWHFWGWTWRLRSYGFQSACSEFTVWISKISFVMQLVHGGIWGHMAVFTSFRKGMPSLTAFSRARWCLYGERFECQQNFHATQNVYCFFFNCPWVLPCLCLYGCQETAFPAAIVVALVPQHRATEDVLV